MRGCARRPSVPSSARPRPASSALPGSGTALTASKRAVTVTKWPWPEAASPSAPGWPRSCKRVEFGSRPKRSPASPVLKFCSAAIVLEPTVVKRSVKLRVPTKWPASKAPSLSTNRLASGAAAVAVAKEVVVARPGTTTKPLPLSSDAPISVPAENTCDTPLPELPSQCAVASPRSRLVMSSV
jgi:hypothetical protein